MFLLFQFLFRKFKSWVKSRKTCSFAKEKKGVLKNRSYPVHLMTQNWRNSGSRVFCDENWFSNTNFVFSKRPRRDIFGKGIEPWQISNEPLLTGNKLAFVSVKNSRFSFCFKISHFKGFSFKFLTTARCFQLESKARKQSFPLSRLQESLTKIPDFFFIFFLWLLGCYNTFSNIFARMVQLALCFVTKLFI